MRLFLALPLPDLFNDQVKKLQEKIENRGNVKPVDPKQVHLTLKFLGDVDEDNLDELVKSLDFLSDRKAFPVTVKGVGVFPHPKRPRVLWLGTEEGSDRIYELHEQIESSLEQLNFKKDKRFTPHYTVARAKFIDDLDELKEFLDKKKEREFGRYMVEEIDLMESKLTPQGPIYTKVEQFSLKE